MSQRQGTKESANLAPDLEIVGDQVTIHPTGFTGGPEVLDNVTERNLVPHMGRFRQNPFDFLREISLFISGTGWRAYDGIIGQPIFYSGFTEKIKSDIMSNPLLVGRIKGLAEVRVKVEEEEGLLNTVLETHKDRRTERKNEIEGNLREVVETMMDNMVCKMESKRFIRGAYYLTTQLLTRAYHQGEILRF
jgi:hypothetical protein